MEKFKIQNREWEVRLESEQFELTKTLLSNYDDWEAVTNIIEQSQIDYKSAQKAGMLIIQLIEKLIDDGLMTIFLSYILVETNKIFSIDQARLNEVVLDKTNLPQLIKIFSEFLKLYILRHTLQQIQELKQN